jgi:hypothetical protein
MTPPKIKEYTPEIEAIADDLIQKMVEAETKSGNFHDLFALPLWLIPLTQVRLDIVC